MSAPPRLFDRRLRRLRLERAGRTGLADFLKRRAAESAVQSLMAIMRPFPLGVDLSANGDALARELEAAGAGDRIGRLVRGDLAPAPGVELALDEEALPFAEGSLDLVVSLLSLHATNDLPGALAQIRRALKPDGLFLGALFGGTTLNELRWALTQAEVEITGGASARVSPFADAYDGAALLQRAGFALPVSDLDRVTVRYGDPFRLVADLRAMGETGVLAERPRPLTRPVLARMAELYVERFGEADGRVPATFDLIHLTGWAPHPDQPKPLRPGSAKVRLADALGVKEQGTGDPAG